MARLLLLCLLTYCALAQDIAGRADQYIQAFVKQNRFQGSALLAENGKPVFRKGYGLANAEWDIQNTPDTKFRLGSITKQFTSALILQLVEQGKVKLDDSIRKYYEHAPEAWQPVTIHHLLSHESGIPSYTEIPHFFDTMAATPRTPAEIAQLTQDKPLEFPPGTKYKYDNTGYVLLGMVVEKVTGKSYESQLRSAILDPLGMQDTGFDSFVAILPHRAEGYQNNNGKLRHAAYLDMSLPYAAGSLYSTVDDLLKWDQALYGDKVLSEGSKQKMWTANLSDYGYGWAVTKRFGFNVVEHGGGINGFNTMIIRIPEKKLLAVVLANANSGAPGTIAAGLLAIALGKPVVTPGERKRISLTSEQLAPYAGNYVRSPDFALKIWAEGDHLMAQATNQGGMPLQPAGPASFFNDVVNLDIEFNRDAQGKVTGLTLHQNGADLEFKRQ